MFILVLCYTDFVFCCAKLGIWCSCVCVWRSANIVFCVRLIKFRAYCTVFDDANDARDIRKWSIRSHETRLLTAQKKEARTTTLTPRCLAACPLCAWVYVLLWLIVCLGGTHAPFRGRSFGTAPLNEWLADATTSGTPKFDQAYMCVFSGSINRRRPALSGCPMIFGSIIRTQYIMCYRVYLANCLWHRILIALGGGCA